MTNSLGIRRYELLCSCDRLWGSITKTVVRQSIFRPWSSFFLLVLSLSFSCIAPNLLSRPFYLFLSFCLFPSLLIVFHFFHPPSLPFLVRYFAQYPVILRISQNYKISMYKTFITLNNSPSHSHLIVPFHSLQLDPLPKLMLTPIVV